MNISIKRAKCTALGKKGNSSRGPTKHRKGPYLLKRIAKGLSNRYGIEKDVCGFFNFSVNPNVLEAYRISGNRLNQHSQCFDLKGVLCSGQNK